MTYEYGNDEKEYIFCVKGRPFPCLVSPHLPTPTLCTNSILESKIF